MSTDRQDRFGLNSLTMEPSSESSGMLKPHLDVDAPICKVEWLVYYVCNSIVVLGWQFALDVHLPQKEPTLELKVQDGVFLCDTDVADE